MNRIIFCIYSDPGEQSMLLVGDPRFCCPLCKGPMVEPRVLPCLHTFCTACLLDLLSGVSSVEGSESGSADSKAELNGHSSGYGSDTWATEVSCPTCGALHRLPPGGVGGLLPDFILQHRMVVASVNNDSTHLLCDLCTTDVPAVSRCSDCLASLCAFCSAAHQRQRGTATHEVLALAEARRRGIEQVRRQLLCPAHPDHDLRAFCRPCAQVACRECCSSRHRGHPCEPLGRAARACRVAVRDALERARPAAERADRLLQLENSIQARCSQVQEEVDRFLDSYVAALEEHRRSLQMQLRQARDNKLQVVRAQRAEAERQREHARTALRFTQDLLAEGSDVELLSFAAQLLTRLEWCSKNAENACEARVSECLQFLPQESAGLVNNHMLFGVITTQAVAPQNCTLNTDGLMNCRHHKKVETVLVTKDIDGQPLCHGGEKVVAELRYKDITRRKLPVSITDRRDGTYLLSFIPDNPGNLTLTVTVRGTPIKGSPFLVCARTLRPHRGQFHCCSFCSSSGSKDATCGCGSKMPGGYRGCGHGHAGHPGRRHWSCCGNILENSECGFTNNSVYQFTL